MEEEERDDEPVDGDGVDEREDEDEDEEEEGICPNLIWLKFSHTYIWLYVFLWIVYRKQPLYLYEV